MSARSRRSIPRASLVIAAIAVPFVVVVACETKPVAIQRDLSCPSVVTSVCSPPAHSSGHTTHHTCASLYDHANIALMRAVEAADSHCSTVDDCVPVTPPPGCGLGAHDCIPTYVSKTERHVFDVIVELRAGACASWARIDCDDYVDDPPVCSYAATPLCNRGVCSVEATYLGASGSHL